jgi:hypothetical protein
MASILLFPRLMDDTAPEQPQKPANGHDALDAGVRATWVAVQKRHSVPVTAIGVPIATSDVLLLELWRRQGIDQFVASR